MPEPKIERYEVIVPSIIESDTYGNITIKTKDNKEIKINKKHESLHELIRQATSEGRAIKLGYAVYMNKEYVHTAELFDGKPPVEKRIEPITAGVEKPIPQSPQSKSSPVKDQSDSKSRAFALSYAKDWAIALLNSPSFTKKETLSAKSIIATAKEFEAYLEGKEVQLAESKLIQEAKKLGAKEEKGGLT